MLPLKHSKTFYHIGLFEWLYKVYYWRVLSWSLLGSHYTVGLCQLHVSNHRLFKNILHCVKCPKHLINVFYLKKGLIWCKLWIYITLSDEFGQMNWNCNKIKFFKDFLKKLFYSSRINLIKSDCKDMYNVANISISDFFLLKNVGLSSNHIFSFSQKY